MDKKITPCNFTFILTGQLDISKTYTWDEFLEFGGYFRTFSKKALELNIKV